VAGQLPTRSGQQGRGVREDQDVVMSLSTAWFRALALPPRRARRCTGCSASAAVRRMSLVPSVEPSETTMTSSRSCG
jgi:hypothetical protein